MSLSDFQILQKIGQGAYSIVYKVKRISDGKIYALKQVSVLIYEIKQVKINSLKQKQKQNALNEVRLLASISCQYIIKYKQSFFDQKSSTLCMIIQYAENGDLQKLIMRNKQLLKWIPEKQIWKMAKHILVALSVLHQKNIIHRDLKSANIFMTKNQYKIADLNVSKLLKQTLAYTQTGTPYYASPEVWQDKPYELKSDIWSLGCILYEASALKPPFTATSMDGLYKKVMKGVYPRLPTIYSDRLQKFIAKCLQISPSKRPSAKNLLDMLPEDISEGIQEQNQTISSQVNLLQTIKIPRNMNSWRNDLPKSKYQGQNFQSISQLSNPYKGKSQNETTNLKFNHLSQQRLRQIVKAKQLQRNVIAKKMSLKKINPQHNQQNYNSVINKVRTQTYQPYYQDYPSRQDQNFLPRINKIRSQSSNDPALCRKINQNHSKVQQILNRMKQADKRKMAGYNYNRPTWWG